MSLHPTVSALLKHKAGVVLISLQIALTLAIVCNALFIIGQRIGQVRQPTGMDENNLFLVSQTWTDAPTGDSPGDVAKLQSLQQTDLIALRQLPEVASVAPTSTLPLNYSGQEFSIALKPMQQAGMTQASCYFGDNQLLSTMGIKLIAGRLFTPSDIEHKSAGDQSVPSSVIVTRSVAMKLFAEENAVGKVIYLNAGSAPTTTIGVVDRLQSPFDTSGDSQTWNSMIFPRELESGFSYYLVRAKPGQLQKAMRTSSAALYAVNPARVIDNGGVRSFTDIRSSYYRADIGMAILMAAISVILVAVTSAGIVGLTTFWVGQRRRQIGVRRALGARKVDILHYFQLENMIIASMGILVGVVLALVINIWLMSHLEIGRMPLMFIMLGVVAMFGLGQAAVFVPACRASNVSPVEATRAS